MSRILLFLLIFSSAVSEAGYFEVSTTASYRKRYYGEQSYEVKETYGGAVSYYFWETSALQLSHSIGYEKAVQTIYTVYQVYKVYGANLVITMANRESPVRPYVKGGGAYIVKSTITDIPHFNIDRRNSEGFAPTAGAGIQIMLSKNFGIKGGIDIMTSPLNESPMTYDFEATGGISFMF